MSNAVVITCSGSWCQTLSTSGPESLCLSLLISGMDASACSKPKCNAISHVRFQHSKFKWDTWDFVTCWWHCHTWIIKVILICKIEASFYTDMFFLFPKCRLLLTFNSNIFKEWHMQETSAWISELLQFNSLWQEQALSFYPHSRTYFYCFLERGEGSKRERNIDVRKKHQLVPVVEYIPQAGIKLQPGYMPWPGMEPMTFWSTSQRSNWTTPSRARTSLKFKTGTLDTKWI